MRGRVYRVEKHMERAIAAALPSDISDEDFCLDRSAVSKRKDQVFAKKLCFVYLVDIHVGRMR
jgi:hypothetical protein